MQNVSIRYILFAKSAIFNLEDAVYIQDDSDFLKTCWHGFIFEPIQPSWPNVFWPGLAVSGRFEATQAKHC